MRTSLSMPIGRFTDTFSRRVRIFGVLGLDVLCGRCNLGVVGDVCACFHTVRHIRSVSSFLLGVGMGF